MLFWMRLLKDALPAGRPHRSPSSIRQQLCPKNGGAGGPSWLSSSVLNPFIPGRGGEQRRDATSTQLSELDALRTNGRRISATLRTRAAKDPAASLDHRTRSREQNRTRVRGNSGSDTRRTTEQQSSSSQQCTPYNETCPERNRKQWLWTPIGCFPTKAGRRAWVFDSDWLARLSIKLNFLIAAIDVMKWRLTGALQMTHTPSTLSWNFSN